MSFVLSFSAQPSTSFPISLLLPLSVVHGSSFTPCTYFDISVYVSVSFHPLFWFCCFSLWSFFYLILNFTLLLFLFWFPLVTITFLSPLGDRGQLSKKQTCTTVHSPCFCWMWLDTFLALAHIFNVGSWLHLLQWKLKNELFVCWSHLYVLLFSWMSVVCCGFFFSLFQCR